jgi:hypothetical protein
MTPRLRQPPHRPHPGLANLTRRCRLGVIGAVGFALSSSIAGAQHLLIPMDDAQQNHLKAYG